VERKRGPSPGNKLVCCYLPRSFIRNNLTRLSTPGVCKSLSQQTLWCIKWSTADHFQSGKTDRLIMVGCSHETMPRDGYQQSPISLIYKILLLELKVCRIWLMVIFPQIERYHHLYVYKMKQSAVYTRLKLEAIVKKTADNSILPFNPTSTRRKIWCKWWLH
jgi:hypothetical protein